MSRQEYECLPEVMADCPTRRITGCSGVFYSLYTACGTRNKAALRERAREEAERYGHQQQE